MRPWTCAIVVAAALLGGCKSGGSGSSAQDDPYAAKAEPGRKLTRFTFEDKQSNQSTGKRLPGEDQLTLVDSEGREVRVADYRGKPLVLVFMRGFAGFVCPYCTTYTAQIATRYQELKDAGAEVLLVYPTEEQDRAKVDEFIAACAEILAEEGAGALPFPVFLDPGLKVVKRYNLEGDLSKPSTFVLDQGGVIRYVYVGLSPDDRPSVDRILKEVRALARG